MLDDLAFSGGCATGWVDLSATASQGPALVVMLVTFALTLPGRAPVTLVSLVTARPAGRSHGEYCVVPVDEIEWIQGDTYCVRVHAGGRERLYRERLSRLELRLEPEQFHRTHRSALVRLDLIRELCAESRYSYSALLSTARECR